MTEWQWSVIVAIVRTLMFSHRDGMNIKDENLFNEVLDREYKK